MPEAIAALLEPMIDCIVPCAVATIAALAVGLFPCGTLGGEAYPVVALGVVPLLARLSVNTDIEMFRFAFEIYAACVRREAAPPQPMRWCAPEDAGAKMLYGIPICQGGEAWRSMDSA